MIKSLICSERFGGEYNEIVKGVCGGIPTAVFGVNFAEKSRLVSSFNAPVLFVVRDGITAKKFYQLSFSHFTLLSYVFDN